MKYTICYVSKAKKETEEVDIDNIFTSTLRNNNRDGITGILLYGINNFFQVIEGEKDRILDLFGIIENDSRHHKINVLINQQVKYPVFARYDTKFNVLKTQEDLNTVYKYLDIFDHRDSFTEKMQRLINPFLLTK